MQSGSPAGEGTQWPELSQMPPGSCACRKPESELELVLDPGALILDTGILTVRHLPCLSFAITE